jgi:hypothetical protein
MSWRDLVVVAMGVSALMAVGGCAHSVRGDTQPVTHSEVPLERGYGYGDDRCGLLLDNSIKELFGAEKLVRSYSGAVCQYVLTRQGTFIDVTYLWFETGSLDRERAVAEANGAQISDVEVDRREAFLARRSVIGMGCSATASTDPGVASWWVQIRGDAPLDPCQQARSLLSKTLSADL